MNTKDMASLCVFGDNIPFLFHRIADGLERLDYIPEIESITLENNKSYEDYLLKVSFVGTHDKDNCSQCKDEEEHPEKYR